MLNNTTQITVKNLYKNACLLKSEDGENSQYDRALIELISYTTGEDLETVSTKLGIKENTQC
jgi:hypothetical protein